MPSLAAPSHAPLQMQQGDSPQERSGTPGKHHTTLKKNTVFSLCVYSLWWWWTTLTITETATRTQQEPGKLTSEVSASGTQLEAPSNSQLLCPDPATQRNVLKRPSSLTMRG